MSRYYVLAPKAMRAPRNLGCGPCLLKRWSSARANGKHWIVVFKKADASVRAYGLMFWFTRNTLLGSYLRFTATRHSKLPP